MTSLSPSAIAASARRAGFPESEIVTAVAVAYAESNGDPTESGHNTDGSTDYGLWMINSVNASTLRMGNWANPDDNARMAYSLWKQYGWKPWVAYNSGAYKRQLSRVGNVSQAASFDPGAGPNSGSSGPFQALTNPLGAFSALTDTALWKRIGIGLVGVFLLIVGLVAIFHREITGAAKTAAKAAVLV